MASVRMVVALLRFVHVCVFANTISSYNGME